MSNDPTDLGKIRALQRFGYSVQGALKENQLSPEGWKVYLHSQNCVEEFKRVATNPDDEWIPAFDKLMDAVKALDEHARNVADPDEAKLFRDLADNANETFEPLRQAIAAKLRR